MSNTGPTAEQQGRLIKAKRSITYLLCFSIVMFFAGLTSAYLVSKGGSTYWVNFDLPAAFWWSTAFILASSLTLHMALVNARRDRKRQVAPWVVATLALGLCFTVSQFKGWHALLEDGYALVSRLKSLQGEYGRDYTIQRMGETLVKQGDQYFLPEDTGFEHPLNAEMDQVLNSASSYSMRLPTRTSPISSAAWWPWWSCPSWPRWGGMAKRTTKGYGRVPSSGTFWPACGYTCFCSWPSFTNIAHRNTYACQAKHPKRSAPRSSGGAIVPRSASATGR